MRQLVGSQLNESKTRRRDMSQNAVCVWRQLNDLLWNKSQRNKNKMSYNGVVYLGNNKKIIGNVNWAISKGFNLKWPQNKKKNTIVSTVGATNRRWQLILKITLRGLPTILSTYSLVWMLLNENNNLYKILERLHQIQWPAFSNNIYFMYSKLMSQKIHAGHLTHLKETFENEKN